MKFKKNDAVIITAGKDKGKKGKIEKVFPRQGKVLVPGLNLYKKHTKPRGQKQPGGIIDIARPFPVGNVAFLCPKCNQPTRLGYQLSGKTKQRFCRKCKQII